MMPPLASDWEATMQSAANLNESPIEVMKHKTPRTLLLPLFARAAITILAFDPQSVLNMRQATPPAYQKLVTAERAISE
ncbi:MAG: hypothetical protein K2G75_06905, partial [Muribaculaceae bacterium]|nr:hypothetical protein [Muribaculaceae bacterium]